MAKESDLPKLTSKAMLQHCEAAEQMMDRARAMVAALAREIGDDTLDDAAFLTIIGKHESRLVYHLLKNGQTFSRREGIQEPRGCGLGV